MTKGNALKREKFETKRTHCHVYQSCITCKNHPLSILTFTHCLLLLFLYQSFHRKYNLLYFRYFIISSSAFITPYILLSGVLRLILTSVVHRSKSWNVLYIVNLPGFESLYILLVAGFIRPSMQPLGSKWEAVWNSYKYCSCYNRKSHTVVHPDPGNKITYLSGQACRLIYDSYQQFWQ